MKSTVHYIYLSGHQSNWLRLYVFATLAMLVAFFAFSVPLWISPVVSTSVLTLLYIINLGFIRYATNRARIRIRDRHHRIVLSPPLEMDSWWHYIYRGKAYANDIHVILHIKDAEDKEVYFSETIMFETRHPNEAPFRDEHIPEGAEIIQVQRVDKLYAYLQEVDRA